MRSNGLKLTLCGVALCAATSAVSLVARGAGPEAAPLPAAPLSGGALAGDEERGKTAPSKEREQIGFSVPGLVSEVLVKEGETVKAGQLLAKLDTSVEQAELDKQEYLVKSNVQLQAATAQRELAEKKLERKEKIYQDKAGSIEEVEEQRLEVTVSKLKEQLANEETESKKYDIAKLKAQIARMTIVAKEDGEIRKIDAAPGEVADPQKPSMVMVVNDPLYVEVNLPSRMTAGMKLGQPMQVRYLDEPNKWHDAKVVFFDPVADASVGRQLVRLEMPNTDHRRSGQEIAVKLPQNLAAAK
jgi:RND family efflux transporter MFP subunit